MSEHVELSARAAGGCGGTIFLARRAAKLDDPIPDMPDAPPQAVPSRSKRTLVWVSTTNFGEGLPWSFLHQMGTEFLTARGASPTQIGSTSLFHLAVTFKFLWSPIVDLVGSKRRWVIATQVVLAGGMVAVAAASSARGFAPFWIVASLLAVVHATHDIACDGFYIQALDAGTTRSTPACASRPSASP